MKMIRSYEVLENRELARQEPELYRIAKTEYVFCSATLCDNGIEVFAKNAPFTRWTCFDCVNRDK
jgi:hypothetical protein